MLSYTVWEAWKAQQIDEELNFKSRLCSAAILILCRTGTMLNTALTVVRASRVSKCKRKLSENFFKIVAGL